MHRIGVIGISWRQRRPELLAAMTIPKEDCVSRLPALRAAVQVDELVYLATCGRVEVVFATDGRQPFDVVRRRIFAALVGHHPVAGEAEHSLRAWSGEGAAEHLFMVASGLDSTRIGESEVAGQFRDALQLAREAGTSGPRLERLFDAALHAARRVRPLTEGRVGRVSLAQLAVRHALDRAGRTGGAVALVGVSAMTEMCARDLAAHGVPLVLVNRTVAHAESLAASVGATTRALDVFRAAPDPVEAVILAAGSSEPVLVRADLERLSARTASGEPPLLIDLGVPPNVAPDAAVAADVPRVGMEEIHDEATVDRERLRLEFADARALIDDAVLEFRRRDAERTVGTMIAQLRLQYRRTAMEGVDRLFARTLPALSDAERDALRRWAETLASRMAHIPTVGLRELAVELGPDAVETFFRAGQARSAESAMSGQDAAEGTPEVVTS